MKQKLLTAALNYCANNDLPNPWKRFVANRRTATKRGIEFKLTFDEWWTLWAVHYHQRGPKRDEYCLCRYLDMGCYEVGNVRVDLSVNNHAEYAVGLRTRLQKAQCRKAGRNLLWEVAEEFLDPLEILLAREAELIG